MTTSLVFMFKELYHAIGLIKTVKAEDVADIQERALEEVKKLTQAPKVIEDIEMQEIRHRGQSKHSRCLCHK
jgi:hypothetical protein